MCSGCCTNSFIWASFENWLLNYSENADFHRFHLIVPQPWKLAKRLQLSLIGSRQCAFHRAIDKPCALPLSPPKSGSKRKFLHLALPIISLLQLTVDTSNLLCGLNIASPSLQMTNRPWNGRGHCNVTSLIFWKISDNILKTAQDSFIVRPPDVCSSRRL